MNECHVLELRIGMNVKDHRSFSALLKQQGERPENLGLNGDSNSNLYVVGAVLWTPTFQAFFAASYAAFKNYDEHRLYCLIRSALLCYLGTRGKS